MASSTLPCAIRLLYAVIGAHSRPESAPNTLTFLAQSDYRALPTTDRLKALAESDRIDLSEVIPVLDAYEAFTVRGEFPSERVVQSLYELSKRRESWRDA